MAIHFLFKNVFLGRSGATTTRGEKREFAGLQASLQVVAHLINIENSGGRVLSKSDGGRVSNSEDSAIVGIFLLLTRLDNVSEFFLFKFAIICFSEIQ